MLDMRIVVLPVWTRPRERHLPSFATPFGYGVAHVLLAIVVMNARNFERDAPERVVERVTSRIHAPVPHRLQFSPLRLSVCRRECPPEVAAHIPAAVRHRIRLDVPWRHVASHDELTGLALDRLEQLIVAA